MCSSECCSTFCLFFILGIIVFGLWDIVDHVQDPRFKVESIELSLQDDNATARWDVGVSVKNMNSKSYVRFGDFNVWVMCMSESSSRGVIPPFKLENRGSNFMNATAETVLSDHVRAQLVRGTVVDVYFQAWCQNQSGRSREMYVLCRGVGVGFLSGATTQGRKGCTIVEGSFSSDSDDCSPNQPCARKLRV